MLDKIVNVNLLKNPLNWLIVVLMVVLFTVGVDLVRRYQASTQET